MAHALGVLPVTVSTRVHFVARIKHDHRRLSAPARAGRGRVTCRAAKDDDDKVEYGTDWYAQTKKYGLKKRSSKEFYDEYRAANEKANNGKERKDLYSDNWDGDEYKGGGFNILTVLILLFVGVPVVGLLFAYQSYGVLWG